MVDRYTKAVLTVIAVALTALAVRPLLDSRSAGAQGLGCGNVVNPCWVRSRVEPPDALHIAGQVSVKVENWPAVQTVRAVMPPTKQQPTR
jgi:hypothetical protein